MRLALLALGRALEKDHALQAPVAVLYVVDRILGSGYSHSLDPPTALRPELGAREPFVYLFVPSSADRRRVPV